MPPFAGQRQEAAALHGRHQLVAVGAGRLAASGVGQGRGRAEHVIAAGHLQLLPGRVDQGDVHRGAAVVPRAPGRVGHETAVGQHRPHLALHAERAVAIVDLEPQASRLEVRLHLGQPFGRGLAQQAAGAVVERAAHEVVGGGVAHIDDDPGHHLGHVDQRLAPAVRRRGPAAAGQQGGDESVEECEASLGVHRLRVYDPRPMRCNPAVWKGVQTASEPSAATGQTVVQPGGVVKG